MDDYPIRHQVLLEALDPDLVILCVNPHDNERVVNRAIALIEGVTRGKVMALVCFPKKIEQSWKDKYGKKYYWTIQKK